jgi:hypothetical protein
MDALTGLLGVDCNYCHVLREWERDDKPQKQTARKMFQMVEYLNHDHFSGENRIYTPVKQTARKMLAMSEATVQRFYGGLSPLGCPDLSPGLYQTAIPELSATLDLTA